MLNRDKLKFRRMGRRGQFFMPLFALVTLIIFTTLYLDLAAKTDQFSGEGDKIGEKQAAVLNAAALGQRAQYYVDISAQHAYDTALLETARSSYLSFDDCSFYRGTAVVYGTTDCMQYQDALQQKVEEKLSEEFNRALTPYLEAYDEVDIPQENYVLLFSDGTVKGIAQEPLEIPIFSTTSAQAMEKVGTGSTSPSAAGTTLFTQWPTAYEEHRINSCFGYRGGDVVSGNSHGTTYHPGVDIRSPLGTTVLAAGAGSVSEISPTRWGRVVIDHGNNLYTEYLHMDTISVTVGQQVIVGDILGTSGGRGKYSATDYDPHLHFGVIDKNIDPTLTDDQNNKAVVTGYDTYYVNPLCYFDAQSISYAYANNLACRSQGGPLKFCELYHQQGISTVSSTGTTTSSKPSASAQAVVQKIDQNYGTIIEEAISGTSIPKSLVIAVIATESGGNPTAGSPTGCMGLMQFCGSTAYSYGLCDDKKCSGTDYRTDPTKTIFAGVKLIEADQRIYQSYSDKTAFGLAAYNGGPAIISAAISATGKTNPSWTEVSSAITSDIVGNYLKGQYFDTTEERNTKVREIQNYVGRVLSYQAAYTSLEEDKK